MIDRAMSNLIFMKHSLAGGVNYGMCMGTEPSSLALPTLNYACSMLRTARVLLSSAYGSAHLSYHCICMLYE